MIKKMYSVFDSKATFFGNPFLENSDASAIRAFSDAVLENNPQNQWNRHPEDFSLFYLADFETDNAQFIFDGPPKNLVTASALKYAGKPEVETPELNLNGLDKISMKK